MLSIIVLVSEREELNRIMDFRWVCVNTKKGATSCTCEAWLVCLPRFDGEDMLSVCKPKAELYVGRILFLPRKVGRCCSDVLRGDWGGKLDFHYTSSDLVRTPMNNDVTLAPMHTVKVHVNLVDRIGSLSNDDDDDGNEDVISKYDFSFL